jgi:hypothetical protein
MKKNSDELLIRPLNLSVYAMSRMLAHQWFLFYFLFPLSKFLVYRQRWQMKEVWDCLFSNVSCWGKTKNPFRSVYGRIYCRYSSLNNPQNFTSSRAWINKRRRWSKNETYASLLFDRFCEPFRSRSWLNISVRKSFYIDDE